MSVSGHVYAVDGWGVGEVWVDGSCVVAHDLPSPARALPGARGWRDDRGDPGPAAPDGGARPPLGTVPSEFSPESTDFVSGLCRRFACHLAGDRVTYEDVEVDDAWCTPFQHALLEALRSVPWGEVVAYGELAALAGRPRAARAAGSFCADNRLSLIVPCHRVVSATSIGGYGDSGVATKRALLRLEGVEL